jgi:hypothetical protein
MSWRQEKSPKVATERKILSSPQPISKKQNAFHILQSMGNNFFSYLGVSFCVVIEKIYKKVEHKYYFRFALENGLEARKKRLANLMRFAAGEARNVKFEARASISHTLY